MKLAMVYLKSFNNMYSTFYFIFAFERTKEDPFIFHCTVHTLGYSYLQVTKVINKLLG